MYQLSSYKQALQENGFSIVDGVYNSKEVHRILSTIDAVDITKDTFRKSSELFAIRQFLKEVPATFDIIFRSQKS